MFEAALWQRILALARAARARLRGWSSANDREFWDHQFGASAHDPFSSSYPGRVTIRRFSDLAEAHLGDASLVVDLGCGPGEITCELARRSPARRFLGFDHSEVAVAQARAHATRAGISNVSFERADLETFVPPAGTGLVTMFDAFHHLLRPEAFVERVGRVCDRFFLIEPAGTALGTWDRRHDLDWIAATVFQMRDRLEFEFGLSAGPNAPAADAGGSGGDPTEHRYTAYDFERFFKGYALDVRGTLAGLEQYGPDPTRQSQLRDRLGEAAYQLVVAVEEAMYEAGLDLAAKHWAIHAARTADGTAPIRAVRRPPERPRAHGLLPGYAAGYSAYDGPSSLRCGESFQATLRVRNAGWRPWSSDDRPPILASYRWQDRDGRRLDHEGLRTPLGTAIAPGQEATILLRVEAPKTPGAATLCIDLVHEGVTWFSDQGVVPYKVKVNIGRD